MSIKRTTLIIMLLIALTGCHKLSYDYLVRNPELLIKEANRCAASPETALNEQCKMIMQAYSDFTNARRELEQDQESFGQQIITIQQTLVKTQQQLAELKRNDNEVAKKQIPDVEMKHKELQKTLNLLYGVESLNSPE